MELPRGRRRLAHTSRRALVAERYGESRRGGMELRGSRTGTGEGDRTMRDSDKLQGSRTARHQRTASTRSTGGELEGVTTVELPGLITIKGERQGSRTARGGPDLQEDKTIRAEQTQGRRPLLEDPPGDIRTVGREPIEERMTREMRRSRSQRRSRAGI